MPPKIRTTLSLWLYDVENSTLLMNHMYMECNVKKSNSNIVKYCNQPTLFDKICAFSPYLNVTKLLYLHMLTGIVLNILRPKYVIKCKV